MWVWVNIKSPENPDFSPCLPVPGFHFGYLFVTHSHVLQVVIYHVTGGHVYHSFFLFLLPSLLVEMVSWCVRLGQVIGVTRTGPQKGSLIRVARTGPQKGSPTSPVFWFWVHWTSHYQSQKADDFLGTSELTRQWAQFLGQPPGSPTPLCNPQRGRPIPMTSGSPSGWIGCLDLDLNPWFL